MAAASRTGILKQGVIVSVLVILTVATVHGQQTWYQLYEKGLAEFSRQNWQDAETSFKAALAKNPRQGRRQLFYGTRREDYLPEYYLAQVYLKLNRAKEAADLLSKIQRDGLITFRDKEYAEVSTLAQRAQAMQVTASVNTEAGRGRGEMPPPDGGVTAGRSAGDAQAAERARREAADNAAALVRTLIDGRRFQDARGTLSAATAVDQARRDQLTRAIDTAEAHQAVETAIAERNWPDAQTGLDRLSLLDSGNARLAAYRESLTKGLAVAAASDVERNALRAFYKGNYAQALSLLDAPPVVENPTSRRLFYMACSNAALGLLQGAAGQQRISVARAQFERAKGRDPQFAVDRGFVSPRILQVLSGPAR